jgi:DNA mismatch repair protein MSH6
VTKPTKFDKVVNREICQITSRGTRVFGILDGETKEAESNFLLAIAEKVSVNSEKWITYRSSRKKIVTLPFQEIDSASSIYGVCFVDTSIGVFHLGQFLDDRHASRLRTLVSHYPPVQVTCEKFWKKKSRRSILTNSVSRAFDFAGPVRKESY